MNQGGDVIRFYIIRIIPDFARYEPRNIGIVAWNTHDYLPCARVDVDVFHVVAEETGFLREETAGYVAEIARGFEMSILRQLGTCSDSREADELIDSSGLRATAYTAYIVERPGAMHLNEEYLEAHPQLKTLDGCVDRLMQRLVLPR